MYFGLNQVALRMELSAPFPVLVAVSAAVGEIVNPYLPSVSKVRAVLEALVSLHYVEVYQATLCSFTLMFPAKTPSPSTVWQIPPLSLMAKHMPCKEVSFKARPNVICKTIL